MKGHMPKSEDNWEAENDARALVEYTKITGDAKRFARAKKALKTIEEDAEKALLHTKVAKKLRALGEDT